MDNLSAMLTPVTGSGGGTIDWNKFDWVKLSEDEKISLAKSILISQGSAIMGKNMPLMMLVGALIDELKERADRMVAEIMRFNQEDIGTAKHGLNARNHEEARYE